MILPHKLATTNDPLTSQAGLLAIGQLMDSMQLAERVDKHFPKPKSNRGFMPSTYIQTWGLMQHQGHFHLDEVRHLSEDTALTDVLGLATIPYASTLGAWLRKTGESHECPLAWEAVNKAVLQAALHRRKKVTPPKLWRIRQALIGPTISTRVTCPWWGTLLTRVKL
jgi:hypothetical protein